MSNYCDARCISGGQCDKKTDDKPFCDSYREYQTNLMKDPEYRKKLFDALGGYSGQK